MNKIAVDDGYQQKGRYSMIHGGDVYTNGLLQGRELIDYSSNINPYGVPKSFINNISEGISALTRYPDIQYRSVLKALKEYTHCPEEYFVLGNGAAEIIDLVIACHKSLLIVVPSFVEYEINAQKWNCSIEYSYLKESNSENNVSKHYHAELSYDYEDILKKLQTVEAVILGNPNNPNGNIIDKTEFQKILEFCENNNKVIIIDEAFIEFTGNQQHSFALEAKAYKCLFIIRALTKFFAMPGIRFGYAISSNSDLIKNIKEKQNPWNINCFAEVAVKYVLRDEQYIEQSKQWIREERLLYLEQLKGISFIDKVFSTYGNYALCKLDGISSEELYTLCLAEGFLIRKCDNYKGLDERYVRLAIKDRSNNEKLITMLKSLRSET
jgi:threonine-phosphate decarboxylase